MASEERDASVSEAQGAEPENVDTQDNAAKPDEVERWDFGEEGVQSVSHLF